ncbi:hypothetical protein GW17_00019878 [Ensete ventricosum]|nr:hypothetical protein GW17_00019878 [Ensete ventricosum]
MWPSAGLGRGEAMVSPKKRKRRVTRRRQRRRRRDHIVKARSRPEERGVDFFSPSVAKYWRQRHSLFSRFDDGILMDEEGWYSVTPEAIAVTHAARAASFAGRACPLVLDGFAGVGGNAIQFASRCDIDPRKIGFAVHNAKIYGVEDRIDFVTGDFFRLAPRLKIEANHVQTKAKAITAYFGDIAAGSSGLSKTCSGVTS